MKLIRFFISPDHNYFGHHGKPAGEHEAMEPDEICCVAGRGLQGDRFFDHKDNYKGQITFFADEVYSDLRQRFKITGKPASVFRRNVLTRGSDLNSLVGQEFEVQGVKFMGVEECKPCYWMDQAFGPGTEDAMKGRGGLRARILTDGILRLDESADEIVSDPPL